MPRMQMASRRRQTDQQRSAAVIEMLEQRLLLSVTAVSDSFTAQASTSALVTSTFDVLVNDIGTGLSIASVGSAPYGTVSIQQPTTQGGR